MVSSFYKGYSFMAEEVVVVVVQFISLFHCRRAQRQ